MNCEKILRFAACTILASVMLLQARVNAFAQSPATARQAGWAHYRVIDLGRVDPSPPGEPNFIANTGLIAGAAPAAGGAVHAVLWFGGMPPMDIGASALGGPNSQAFGINDRGQVLGTGQTSDVSGEDFWGFNAFGNGHSDLHCCRPLPHRVRQSVVHGTPPAE